METKTFHQSICGSRGDDPTCRFCLCQYASSKGCQHPFQVRTETRLCDRCHREVAKQELQKVGWLLYCPKCVEVAEAMDADLMHPARPPGRCGE